MIKFHKATLPSTYVAYGETLIYTVSKSSPPGRTQWYVRVFERHATPGVPGQNVAPTVYAGERIAHTTTSTKSLAYGVAQAFDALGDDYKPHEHGHRSRLTEAVLMAYADDAVVQSAELQESLAQMRRGDVVEA
jgi:hypothetical protein